REHWPCARFRGTGVTEYWIETAASVCLDVSGPDHLAPLLGLFDDDLLELGRRHGHWHTAELGKTRLDLLVREARVYFFVERDNDFVRRAFGRADALPRACFEA